MDDREKKLPRWARDELQVLRSQARELRLQLDALARPAVEGDQIVYRHLQEMRALPELARPRVSVAGTRCKDPFWAEIYPTRDGLGIEVMCTTSAFVELGSANHFVIREAP